MVRRRVGEVEGEDGEDVADCGYVNWWGMAEGKSSDD